MQRGPKFDEVIIQLSTGQIRLGGTATGFTHQLLVVRSTSSGNRPRPLVLQIPADRLGQELASQEPGVRGAWL